MCDRTNGREGKGYFPSAVCFLFARMDNGYAVSFVSGRQGCQLARNMVGTGLFFHEVVYIEQNCFYNILFFFTFFID